ncbi:uncharacterized protein B0T15DRAFT_152690 [Chaetomium strumarium]|uniref:Secreted protein n=1 Tax=Chaetomium strumarium TaxID=1170767 RepID=A0AAJ0GVA3_9PEZI|nr:hypothetical protein B0T15DRAFT_152690 [Chaetomium strumarium]
MLCLSVRNGHILRGVLALVSVLRCEGDRDIANRQDWPAHRAQPPASEHQGGQACRGSCLTFYPAFVARLFFSFVDFRRLLFCCFHCYILEKESRHSPALT